LSFSADVITLFPDLFPGPLGASVIGRGLGEGLWSLRTTQLRDFATDKHRTVDDTPAGGGPGMVLKPDVLARAIDAVSPPVDPRPRLLMSPRGVPLTQGYVRELVAGPGAVIVCGRFEGVDERVIAARNLVEVSIGDFVLAGGEVAAMALLEAVVRLIPGVLGAADSHADETFEQGLLEYPQFTRPQVFEQREIPAVLVSGDHGRIAAWRKALAEALTRARRPDLLATREGERPPPSSGKAGKSEV
jgi:tRNA (guanine37-N1)-methyltransferase